MAETLVLYLLILFICLISTAIIPNKIFTKESRNSKTIYYITAFLPIIFYTIFWGFRDGVGADYSEYKYLFNNATLQDTNIEIGYLLINITLKNLGFSYTSIFLLTSFFSIYTLFYISRKQSKTFAVFIIYYFFTTATVFFFMNGIRQSLALCFIWIIIVLLKELKKTNYILIIVYASIGYSMHKSIIFPFLIISLLFFIKEIKINKFALIGLAIIITFKGEVIRPFIEPYYSYIFKELGYSSYYETLDDYTQSVVYSSGLGRILKLCIYTIIIYFQDSFLDKRNKPFQYYSYYLFLIGILIAPLIADNPIIKRMNIYFINSSFIIFSFVSVYLWHSKIPQHKTLCLFLLISNLMLYISSILGNSNLIVPYKMISAI